jgi:hypothetical protein
LIFLIEFFFFKEADSDIKRKSRFNIVQRYKKSKIKHKDDKELLKTLHGKIFFDLYINYFFLLKLRMFPIKNQIFPI